MSNTCRGKKKKKIQRVKRQRNVKKQKFQKGDKERAQRRNKNRKGLGKIEEKKQVWKE